MFLSSDIRELIQVDDVMEDDSLRFGPNGGLVFCMEYFANNFVWLEETLGHTEDDYILFDCPGDRPRARSPPSARRVSAATPPQRRRSSSGVFVFSMIVERRVSCVGRSD